MVIEMKKILFTGARSGIINKVIDKLDNNYYIYVTVENERQLTSVKEKYKNKSNIECFKLDITNKEDRDKVNTLDVDILVSNAAVGMGGAVADIPFERVRHNYEVNVFSNFELIQLVLKQMIKKDSGKIIIMSSLASILPLPFLGSYCSTKSSISMLSMCLRDELSLISNVQIKMIQPGLYHTGFNQVMFENKDDYMNLDSFFTNILDNINRLEGSTIRFLEKQSCSSIVRQIVKAIETKNNKFIYRAPLSQNIVARIYGFFRW